MKTLNEDKILSIMGQGNKMKKIQIIKIFRKNFEPITIKNFLTAFNNLAVDGIIQKTNEGYTVLLR